MLSLQILSLDEVQLIYFSHGFTLAIHKTNVLFITCICSDYNIDINTQSNPHTPTQIVAGALCWMWMKTDER